MTVRETITRQGPMTLYNLREAVALAEELESQLASLEELSRRTAKAVSNHSMFGPPSSKVILHGVSFNIALTTQFVETIKLHAYKQMLDLIARSQVAGVDTSECRQRLMAAMESSCVSA